MKKKTIDMTNGSIVKSLILFSLPLLVSSIIQQMYNTVDLLFVGNILGTSSAAAVGAGSMLITCLIGLFSGMAVGTNVVLAKFFGSSDNENLKKGIHTAISIAFAGGIIITIIGISGAPYFLKLMNTPNNIMNDAVSYIRIYFISITSMILYNMCSGIIRAGGNSKIPMMAQFIGGIINIFANILFLYIFNFGIKGSAVATLFSQTVSAIIVLLYLVKQKGEFHFDFRSLKIHKDVMKKIIIIGVPAGIQALVISLSNVTVQSYINSLDVYSITAFVCYTKIELLIYYPIVAIGQAVMTFTGQNMGAKKIDRMKKGAYISIALGMTIVFILSMSLLKSGSFWFGLFDSDINVISKGLDIISVTFPFYIVYVIMEVLSSAIRGTGKSIPPMIIILSNVCILRILLLYLIVPHVYNVKGIAVVYPITWISSAICLLVYYIFFNKINQ